MISLEKPQRKWASSRLEGRTSWIFSSCGRCSRVSTETSGTRSGRLAEKFKSLLKMSCGLGTFSLSKIQIKQIKKESDSKGTYGYPLSGLEGTWFENDYTRY